MKQLLLLLIFLIAVPAAYAQPTAAPVLPIDPATHLVTYAGVVQMPEFIQDQLFTRACAWAAARYKQDRSVMQVQDKANGKIVIKGYTKALVNGRDCGPVAHTLSLTISGGSYRYEVTNFVNTHHTPTGEYGMGPFENEKPLLSLAYSDDATNALVQNNWNTLRTNTDADVKSMLAFLQAALANGTQDKTDF